jgi:hypothetical protein
MRENVGVGGVPQIPNLGLAFGFGVIGFAAAYIIGAVLGDYDMTADIGVGAVVGGIVWLILALKRKGA